MNTKKLLGVFGFFSLTIFGIFSFATISSAQERIPTDDIATCNLYSGACEYGGSCLPLNAKDQIGYCLDAPSQPTSCCKAKASVTLPGGDDYCTNTLKGNCVKKSSTCGSSGVQVEKCSTDAAGAERICCRSTGPGSAEFCTGTMKGTCVAKTAGCTSPKIEVQVCPNVGGAQQICCATPDVNNGALTGTYQLLEKIPGSTFSATESGKLNIYLQDIYNFAFWAVGIAVVFMLTIGGFLYLTSAGNTSRLGTAKTIIFDAFLGLILALVAWMFLNIINPDLVKLNLPTSITVNPTIPPTNTGGTPTGTASILMTAPGVTVSAAGDCKMDAATPVSPQLSLQQQANGQPVTACQAGCPGSGFCTNQTTLSQTMMSALIDTAGIYPFTITSFTGGSHSGGSAHYTGRAVDLVPSAAKTDWPSIATYLRTKGATLVICDIPNPSGSGSVQVNCDSSSANHIHAQW